MRVPPNSHTSNKMQQCFFFKSGKSVVWFLIPRCSSFPAGVMKGIAKPIHMPDASTGLILFGRGWGHHVRALWMSRDSQERLSNMHSDHISSHRIARLLVNAKGKSGLYYPFMKETPDVLSKKLYSSNNKYSAYSYLLQRAFYPVKTVKDHHIAEVLLTQVQLREKTVPTCLCRL